MKEEIVKRIEKFGRDMVIKYPGLSIGYEYSDRRRVVLVSYYTDNIDNDLIEEFSADCLSFSYQMEDEYGYGSPLFCRNEELFKLSDNRKVIDEQLTSEALSIHQEYLELLESLYLPAPARYSWGAFDEQTFSTENILLAA